MSQNLTEYVTAKANSIDVNSSVISGYSEIVTREFNIIFLEVECTPSVDKVSCLCLDVTKNYKVTVDGEEFTGSFEDVVTFLDSHGLYAYPGETTCNPAPPMKEISCEGALNSTVLDSLYPITGDTENTVIVTIKKGSEIRTHEFQYIDAGDTFADFWETSFSDWVELITSDYATFSNKVAEHVEISIQSARLLNPPYPYQLESAEVNPTFKIIDGVIQFCLAPYVPPIEEPVWDIKYLVNGSWIYETTGPIVEQDANRDMYRTTATELVISDSVTEISYYAFRFWSALTSVKLGQSIRVIGSRAFEDCSYLTEFICPDSLESIAETALGGCYRIRLLEFGTNLISIGDAACASLSLLETAVFRGRIMPTLGDYAFGNGGSNSPRPSAVYVPDDLLNEYAGVLWNLADISKFRPLSTYES